MRAPASLALAAFLAACSRPSPDPAPAPASSAASVVSAAPASTADDAGADASRAQGAPDASPTPSGPDARRGTVVLHIGDSFTHAHFQQNLLPRFTAVGAKYRVNARTSTYSTTWANPGEIGPLLWSKPALVLITLGANEWDMPKPNEHAGAVEQLSRTVSKVAPCVWISPPSWKPSTGFKDVIRDHSAPCLFFDSDQHVPNIERQRDGIHPNEAGGARWAAGFWDWLEAHRVPAKGPWALE